MSTPREARLVRVPGLRAFHRALASLAVGGDALEARQRVVIVPSSASAAHLRETLERVWLVDAWRPPAAWCDALGIAGHQHEHVFVAPATVTRAGFYARLFEALRLESVVLDAFSREAIMRAAARLADARGTPPPFLVRPGIVAEMVQFYDAILRQQRSIDDVERLLVAQLADEADTDRGAARLLAQTHFMVATFREFERRTAASQGVDEHVARTLACRDGFVPPWTHVVIAVADHAAEPAGLWPADFDLLARLPHVSRIDVVATEAVLDTGFRERLESRLPGITDVRLDAVDAAPTVIAPDGTDVPYFLVRDREAELELIARVAKLDAADGRRLPHDVAVVVQRPLPYIYLARHAFAQAGVPWTASDALPLAAEPFVAAFDLVVSCLFGNFTRADVVGLLASPLFDFGVGPLPSPTIAAFDECLARAQYFADRERLGDLAQAFADEEDDAGAGGGPGDVADDIATVSPRRALASAVRAILASLPELDPPRRMSEYLSALREFVERFERRRPDEDQQQERYLRSRRAMIDALVSMQHACLTHDDPALPFRDVVAIVRRWIESQTFSPRVGRDGVRVLDAASARFASMEALWIAGLLEGEWPPSHSRVAFYRSELLADLGWPSERLRLLAERAMFDDLVRAPRTQVALSAVTLEDDAVTRPSVYLEDLDVSGLPLARVRVDTAARVTDDEAMLGDPVIEGALPAGVSEWLAWRTEGARQGDPRFHGAVGPFVRARHTVTALETYLECPFKYFARHVLELEENDDDVDGLSPKDSGRILHTVLERFLRRWDAVRPAAGGAADLDRARRLFAEEADEALASLDPRDRAIERTRLIGSALAVGAGERVLSLEFDDPDDEIVERTLETSFDRAVAVEAGARARAVRLRGTIDRVDVFRDGTFRVIDYKRGNSAPSGSKALQLPIYALAVEQESVERGRPLTVREARYMALGPRGADARVIKAGGRDAAVGAAQARLLDAVEGIERGEFPPRPREVHLCTRCAFAAVCRKDYVSDGETPTA